MTDAGCIRGVIEVYSGGILVRRISNIITGATRNRIRNSLAGTTGGVLAATHLALGDGAAAPNIRDTDMDNEVWRAAFASLATDVNYRLGARAFLPQADATGKTLSEIGIFTAASGGELVARAAISPAIAKTALKSYTFVYTIDLGPQ